MLGEPKRFDPGVAARDRTPEPAHPRVRATATLSAARGPLSELARLRKQGELTPDEYRGFRAEYKRCVAFASGLTGAREADMLGVIGNVRSVAARGMLTRSRLDPLWLNLRRNREWWSSGPLLPSGERVSFKNSEVVFQYFPGEGLQFHPLANFGKLNALVGSKPEIDRMRVLMGELLDLGVYRAGALAWEYYFDFGGGLPAWVSGLSQGTALQSLARAAARSGDSAEVFPLLRQGLKVFERRTPSGVRVPVAGPGDHYAQYSFAPSLRILNGFIQSLNGLHDFARLTGDPGAQKLFERGDARARREVPTYDTGAWSLYARGSSYSESSLEYHVLLRDFLTDLCDKTAVPVHCETEERFSRYLDEPPVLDVLTRRVAGGRDGTIRFKLSKISRVGVTLHRGGRQVYAYSATLGFGRHGLTVKPPRGASAYEVRTTATDLAGNTRTSTETVDIGRK